MAAVRARHAQLPAIIAEVKPHRILEIGCHRGFTTRVLIDEALKCRAFVTYHGLDLFEPSAPRANAHLHETLNKRKPPSEKKVERLLQTYPRVTWRLVKGPSASYPAQSLPYDLVFIDGSYLAEDIGEDIVRLCEAKCIVVNNFFTFDKGTKPFDKWIGANNLPLKGWKKLPAKDPVPGYPGAWAQFIMKANP